MCSTKWKSSFSSSLSPNLSNTGHYSLSEPTTLGYVILLAAGGVFYTMLKGSEDGQK